ncbi:MAG: FkbM family methyltransferase [Marivirga sp.]|jgi:FkbM family methyltransferase
MNLSNFLYRQKQKIKYHLAKDEISQLVAEINRFEELILLGENRFKLKSVNIEFPNKYLFLLRRYNDLVFLIWQRNSYFEVRETDLIYNTNNLKLSVKTAEELFIIKEVYFNQIYNIKLSKHFNLIDVGMNVGFTSLYFAHRDDVRKIYSYEPFGTTFQDAQRNFELNQSIQSKIQSQNIGLGLENEEIQVNYSKDLKGKNTSKFNRDNLNKNFDSFTTIKIVNGRDEIEKITSSKSHENFVVKLDCEGAEFDIFRSFGENRFPDNIDAFMIEWHKNEPDALIEKLLNDNFKVHCTSESKDIGFILAIR